MVEIDDLVEAHITTPVAALALGEFRALRDGKLRELVGTCAHRVLGDIAAFIGESPMDDGGGVVVQVLRNGKLRSVQVQPHRVAVHLLHSARRHLLHFLAVGSFRLVHHGGEQSDVRRPGGRIQPALEVEHHVVGVEVIAVVPLHALPETEGPGLEIVGRFPLLGQIGTGDIVRAGDGQIFEELA